MKPFVFLFIIFTLLFNCSSKPESLPGVTGELRHFPEFKSQFVQSRQVDVWVPPSYQKNPGAHYPVLYMHDGQNLFDPHTSFIGVDWGVDETITRLVEEENLPEAMVVAVWNTPRRVPEYMPQKAFGSKQAQQSFLREIKSTDSLQSDAYLKFLVRELKPFIDSTFRTRPERDYTFIAGSSMGGLISLYGICEYPDVFGRAACVSTHWPAGNGIMLEYMENHLPNPLEHRIYFDYGTKTLDTHYEPYQRKADSIMVQHGYIPGENWLTRKFSGHEHSERAWRKRFHVIYKFLIQDLN